MRRRDTRKAIAQLSRICRDSGIDLQVDRGRGKGSHKTLIFVDRKTGRRVAIVIAGTAEISPGVQRGMIAYVAGQATRIVAGSAARQVFETVRGILETYFSN